MRSRKKFQECQPIFFLFKSRISHLQVNRERSGRISSLFIMYRRRSIILPVTHTMLFWGVVKKISIFLLFTTVFRFTAIQEQLPATGSSAGYGSDYLQAKRMQSQSYL